MRAISSAIRPPRFGGMLHLGVDQVFAQGFVHLVGAGRNGFYQAAAADDGRQLADVEVLLFGAP